MLKLPPPPPQLPLYLGVSQIIKARPLLHFVAQPPARLRASVRYFAQAIYQMMKPTNDASKNDNALSNSIAEPMGINELH